MVKIIVATLVFCVAIVASFLVGGLQNHPGPLAIRAPLQDVQPDATPSRTAPIVGQFTETATITQPPPIMLATSQGTGYTVATGVSGEAFNAMVDFSTPLADGCFADSAVGFIKTLATGDKIAISAKGEYCATTGTDSGTFSVPSGTGAYTGVHGGGTYTATADLTTGVSVEHYSGVLLYP